jgi:serralysin
MDAVGGSAGTGPELKFVGSVVVAGQFSGWILLGAEQTSGGYEVAWKNPTTGSFTVWNTDSHGNEISGSSQTAASIASFETSFHQDLNGDEVIGTAVSATATVIEAFGATKLDQIGNNYFMDPVGGSAGTGPELKFGGSVVVAGQFSGWTLLGTEQTSGAYEVAWKNPTTGSFTVWNTDSNGNEISGTSETATSIVSFETSFHQDLNDDGVIVAPPTTAAQTISMSHQNSANFNFRPNVDANGQLGGFVQPGGSSGLPSHAESPTPAGLLQNLLESNQPEHAIAASPDLGHALTGLFGDHLDHFLIH